MANKRVSELSELLATQVDASDLFLITDVSAFESKRIRASQLQGYALNGTASYASYANSASYSLQSSTASFLQYNGWFNGSASYAISASYALSASYADWAKTASYVLSASWALSSSYASMSFWATTASYALTASVNIVVSSALATLAESASYLIYTPGFNNGTASYAISGSHTNRANTSSYLLYSGIPNGTASLAFSASLANTASFAVTSSFLTYTASRPNGTASFAISASSVQWSQYTYRPTPWGVYTPSVYSITESRITSMSFIPVTDTFTPTAMVTAIGTAIVIFTSSYSNTGSITLVIREQATNTETVLDTSWIGFESFGTGEMSGSLTVPFTLTGMTYPVNSGYHTLFVTASTLNVELDTRRPTLFKVDSNTDVINVV